MFQLALVASVVLLSSESRSEVDEDLEPCQSIFSTSPRSDDPYYLAVRDALLGKQVERSCWQGDRFCQMVAIPSFEPEWAVYIRLEIDPGAERGEGEDREFVPAIVFKRCSVSLYQAMDDLIWKQANEGDPSIRGDSRTAALQQLSVEVEKFMVPVSDATVELLVRVWDRMLARVRYPKESTAGRYDGVMYFAAHWGPDSYDERSGETWSPDEGTRTRAFVEIAEAMGDLARSIPVHRPAKEAALAAAARSLLKRPELLDEPAGDR